METKKGRCGSIQKSLPYLDLPWISGRALNYILKFALLPFCCTHNSFSLLGFVIKSHSFHLVLITMVPSVCLHHNTTCSCFAEMNFRRSKHKKSDGEVTNYKMSPFLFHMLLGSGVSVARFFPLRIFWKTLIHLPVKSPGYALFTIWSHFQPNWHICITTNATAEDNQVHRTNLQPRRVFCNRDFETMLRNLRRRRIPQNYDGE